MNITSCINILVFSTYWKHLVQLGFTVFIYETKLMWVTHKVQRKENTTTWRDLNPPQHKLKPIYAPGNKLTGSTIIITHLKSFSPSKKIDNHLKSTKTIQNHLKLSETIYNLLKTSKTICHHLKPSESIWNHLQPTPTIYNHLKPSTTNSNHLQPTQTIYNQLKWSKAMYKQLKPY